MCYRIAASYKEVGQVNTATHTQPTPGQADATEMPPVLVRVPWLAPRSTTEGSSLPRATTRPAVDRTWFKPHQLVAAADTEVTDFGTCRTHWRFDPPQELPVSAEVHHRHPSPSPPVAPPIATSLPPTLPVRAVTTPTSEGITHLRFDPPINTVAEPAIAVELTTHDEPSAWHHTVTILDAVLRKYHRVVMLVALIAATGLMVLVLDNRQNNSEPSNEGTTPPTIDTSGIGAMPLAESAQAEPLEIPQRVAAAHGPGRSQRAPVPAVSSDNVEIAPLMLEPIEPHRESHHDGASLRPAEPSFEPAGAPYPTTGNPAYELTFPATNTASENAVPLRARLSQDIQLAPQQIQQ